jgi:hypothetical protein
MLVHFPACTAITDEICCQLGPNAEVRLTYTNLNKILSKATEAVLNF